MSASRWQYRARVLVTPGREDAYREVARIGVRPPSDDWMADKATFRAVRLEQVDGRAAAILKQEMLTLGGDCVINENVAAFDRTPRPVVLLGTLRQFRRLISRTIIQPFGIRDMGESVRRALKSFEPATLLPLQTPHGNLVVGEHTLVMGILNLTDDSFSGDGIGGNVEAAVAQARSFAEAGAELLDLGAESTRPGAQEVPEEVELERLVPVIRALRQELDLPLSVDTRRPAVARAAVEAGADIINDVYGLREPGMLETVAELGTPAILMHMQGTPRDMQNEPHYEDVMTEVYEFFVSRLEACVAAGIEEQRLLFDPGFGFGKTVEHNLEILRRLREFTSLGRPLVVGTSRKSTLGKVLDKPVGERQWGTAATVALSIAHGADIVRVHDVAEMVQVARMTEAVVKGKWTSPGA